jgi:hypothetical protein
MSDEISFAQTNITIPEIIKNEIIAGKINKNTYNDLI